MTILHEMSLDLSITQNNRFRVKYDDNGHSFNIYLRNSGLIVDLTNITTINCTFVKPDGTKVIVTPTIVGNRQDGLINVNLTRQCVSIKGDVEGWVELISATDDITFDPFFITVEAKADTQNAVISSNEYTFLQDLTTSVSGIDKTLAIVNGAEPRLQCKVATTANITLSGLQTIDGVTVVVGDRVLVKDQTLSSQNGIFTAQSGSWIRATDANSSSNFVYKMYTYVSGGTINANSGWMMITSGTITVGTTNVVFTQVFGQTMLGNGLTKTSNTLSVTPITINGVTDNHNANLTIPVPYENIGMSDVFAKANTDSTIYGKLYYLSSGNTTSPNSTNSYRVTLYNDQMTAYGSEKATYRSTKSGSTWSAWKKIESTYTDLSGATNDLLARVLSDINVYGIDINKNIYRSDTLTINNPDTVSTYRSFFLTTTSTAVAGSSGNGYLIAHSTGTYRTMYINSLSNGVWEGWRRISSDEISLVAGNKLLKNVCAIASSGTITGTLKITFPISWVTTMLNIEIEGYNHSSISGWSHKLSGYASSTNTSWSNTSTVATGGVAPFQRVRYAHDGTKCCILLGDTTTVWSYPKIYIKSVLLGDTGASGNTITTNGWSMSFITDETGITTSNTTPESQYVINADESTKLVAGTDLNKIITVGRYYSYANADNCSNVPIASTSFSLLVEKHYGWKQTWTSYLTTSPRVFVRNSDNTGTIWGSWYEIGTSYNSTLSTTANITYYVDTTNGSDSDIGTTSGTAFKTIQKAINMIPQTVNHTVTINLASGTYTENVTLNGFSGKGTINIIGGTDLASSVNFFINGTMTVNNTYISVYFKFLKTVNIAHTCSSYLEINTCTIDGTNGNSVASFNGVYSSKTIATYVVSSSISNCMGTTNGYAFYASYFGNIFSNGNTGSGNRVCLNATTGGKIVKNGTQPTGTTQEITSIGGTIA